MCGGGQTYPTVTSKMLLPIEDETAMSPKPFLKKGTIFLGFTRHLNVLTQIKEYKQFVGVSLVIT